MLNPKAELFAPCGFKGSKGETYYPQVICSYDCASCVWNPKESRRRWEEGEWKPVEQRVNAETGEIVKLNGVRQLVFRRKNESV